MKPPLQWRNFVAITDVILQGGGDHAKVVLDCLLAQKQTVLALFDPKYNNTLFGIKQRGTYDPDFAPGAMAIVAIGENALRKKVAQQTRHNFTNAIHPTAIFSPVAKLGTGCMILHGAIIQANAALGNHVIVNTGAQVDHDCIIDDFVHLAPGSILCGQVSVGEGTLIGAGTVVIPGVKIGKWVTVGAGAVVIADIPDHAIAVGNPARIIKLNSPA